MTTDTNTLSKAWLNKWPDSEPGVFDNRQATRFLTLPLGKRYPENEDEERIVLKRYTTILSELAGAKAFLVFVSRWSNSSKVEKLTTDLKYWMTLLENPDEDDPNFKSYRHIFVKESDLANIGSLLERVMNDEESGVVIAPSDFDWLYHPYDGGVDVLARDDNKLKMIKANYSQWLA